MPLDRLPPAPAPSAPLPQRPSRAAGEDAQTFALPEDNQGSSAQAGWSARNANKAREPQERETASETPSNQNQDTPAQPEAQTLQTQPTSGSAHMLNEAASATQGDAQVAAGETDLAAANPDGDALPSGAAANSDGKSGANAAPATTQPTQASPGLDTAPEETAAFKPDSTAKTADTTGAGKTTAAESEPRTAPRSAPTLGQQAEPSDASQETVSAASKTSQVTSSGTASQASEDASEIDTQDAPRPVREAEAARSEARPADAAPAQKDVQAKTDQVQTAGKTVAQEAAAAAQKQQPQTATMASQVSQLPEAISQASEAEIDTLDTPRPVREADSARSEARPADSAPAQKEVQAKTDQVQTAGKPVAQEAAATAIKQQSQTATTASQATQNAETSSASALAGQAEADASTQAALRQSEADARNVVSDRSPGAQNKARHGEKDIAAPSAGAKAQSETTSASASRSASETSAAATSRTQQPSAAAATSAPTDPLAWLLQDSLLAADAPLDVPADSADADLDLSTVRIEPRIEAARPSQHPQAHAASRFAPTTTQTLAAQITRKFNDGGRVFDIRLDPPELGRVEVRLELGPDNKVSALLSAERADTLSELQRNARDLEKALADAGLELGEDGLSFSLSEDNGAFSGFQNETDGSADGFSARNQFTVEVETDLPGAPLADALYGFAVSQRAGVNLIA